MFRKRLYEIIEIADEDDFFSKAYDIFMMFTIIASILPMCFINQTNCDYRYIVHTSITNVSKSCVQDV
jgi:voltage-gated potassium channel